MVSKEQKTKKLTMTDREIAGDLLNKAEKGFFGFPLKKRLRWLIHTLGIHEYKTIRDRNGRRVKKCEYCSNIKLFGKNEEFVTGPVLAAICFLYSMTLLVAVSTPGCPLFFSSILGVTASLTFYGLIKVLWQAMRSGWLD